MSQRTIPQNNTLPSNAVTTIVSYSGELVEIFFTKESGKIVARPKIDTITHVWHPGICLGRDRLNRLWVAHNHYEHKRPVFELYALFLKGKPGKWDNRQVDYSRIIVVERAIREVQRGKSFDMLNYNCQTFVNLIIQDKNKSEAVEKISNGTMFLGIIFSLVGLATRNRGIFALGAGIIAIGGCTKAYSQIRK